MIRPFSAIAMLAVTAGLGIAGCGGSSSGESNPYRSGKGAGAAGASSGESSGGYGGGRSMAPGSTRSASTAPGSTAPGSEAGLVSVASVGSVGRVLVNSEGLTLYIFEKDKGSKSSCYGACASAWPPLRASGMPHAAGGAQPSKLGTTTRKDGTIQVTYAGWPLYRYAADVKPGEANGAGVDSFGAVWRPLRANGEKAGE